MRKITQNLRWLVTLLAMIVSMGAWATVYKLTITASDFNTTSYAANNNEKTSTAVCTTDATKKFEVKWTSNQVMKNGDNMQWQKSGGYLYKSTNLGTIKSVTVTSSGGTFTTYYGTSEHPTSGTTVGNGFFTVKVGNATGTSSKVEVVFEKGDPAATPTFSVAGGEYTEAQSVEISCTTEGATIYYTTDGNEPTTSSTEYSGAIDISSTTTLKAIAVKSEMRNSDVAEVKYTINIPQPVSEAQYALVTSNDQLEAGKEYIIVGKYSTSDTYFAMSTTQNENNRGIVGITVSGDIATISSSDVQVITLEGSSKGWYFKAGNGYLYAASSGSNWLRTEEEADDNAKAIIDIASNGNATIEFQGANKRNLLRFNSNNSIFSCYGSGQLPVQLYKKVEATPEVINVTLSASGISSYCHANALDFSQATCEDADADALKAYAVIAVNSTSATLEEINNPKGNTGLILIGTGGATYSVPVSSSGDTPTDNYLVGTTTSTVVVAEEGYSYYALSGGEFVKLNINGSAIQANKAYLRVPNSSSGAKTLNLSIDGVDAIESVEVEDNTEFVIYNLAGQRMNTLHKGINIMNGKKVIVK